MGIFALQAGEEVNAGALLGVILEFFGERLQLNRYDDGTVLVGALAAIAVATAVIWLVLPDAHYPTLSQFTLGFVWASVLAFVGRRIVWPRLEALTEGQGCHSIITARRKQITLTY